MKKNLAFCALMTAWVAASSEAKVETLDIESQAMHKAIKTCVVLPESYQAGGNPLPVVYLLHGWSGNYQSWVREEPEITQLADLYKIIVVCPDGGYSSWYFDSPIDKTFRYETFVAKEVVERIDATYSTITNRNGRAISGLSMGGHGALYLAFKHQDVFGAAASMSGGVDIRPFPTNWNISERLGDYATHPQNWETNSVINLVYLLKPNSLAILLDCGTSDFFYRVNKKLHEELLYRNIQHDYIEREGGHTVAYWQNSLPYHMLFFHRYFSKQKHGANFPIKVSSTNPRILADQNNAPFLMVGDSPHSLLVNLSASDAAAYLADRAAHGFNSLWVELLCVPYTGGRTNGSLLDGTKPFTRTIPGTSSYDFTAPNEAYFAYVDEVMRMAATNGIGVMLDPIDPAGLLPMALDNGSARCRAYGRYLGNRYKDSPNIIWLNGNDYQNWSVATNDAVMTSVALGIKDKDTNHIQTVELNYQASSSLDDPNWTTIVSLNLAYTYYATYGEVLHAYNQSTNVPVFMGEANYECETNADEDGGSLPILRMQEYWTMLSGATGQLYGNRYTWTFAPGWKTNLDLPGVTELNYMKDVFSARKWYELVPDQAHTFVTDGYGKFISVGPSATKPGGRFASNDYVTAALTPDGSLGMAYLPKGGTVTVAMTRLQNGLIARWFDPTANTFKDIVGSPFTNTGTQPFTTPGKNSAGDPDWVLVLERTVK